MAFVFVQSTSGSSLPSSSFFSTVYPKEWRGSKQTPVLSPSATASSSALIKA